MQRRLAEANSALATQRQVPAAVRDLVGDLADRLADPQGHGDFASADPYLVVELQQAALGAVRALEDPAPATQRRLLRVRLEQMRHVFRDLAEQAPISGERSAKAVVQWLAGVARVPQRDLADVLGVSERTLQRWLSSTAPNAPEGDDERRVRTVAQIINHLRHSLTGVGALQWFSRPRAELAGRTPVDLLAEPESAPILTALAAGVRSHAAG